MEILQNQGTFTTAFDNAVINDILCQFKNGRVKGWLNELEVFEISSSAIGIKSGYAIIVGRVVVNRETITITNAVLPQTRLLKHIVIRITAIDNLTSTVEVINRDFLQLTQDNIKYNETGVYEAELCRYNIDSNGISNLVVSLDLLPIVNQDSLNNLIGPEGKSAFDIWLDAGNTGTEEDFINSLIGPQGPEGLSTVGKSAYEIWLDAGNIGSEEDFLNWLRGEQGIIGLTGKSAYEIWLDQGNTGSEEDFLISIANEMLYEKLKIGKIIKINDNLSSQIIRAVFYANNYFIYSAHDGVKAAKLSPTNQWEVVNVNNTNTIRAFAYLNEYWIGIGEVSKLSYLKSTNPLSQAWNVRNIASYSHRTIEYGNGVYLIGGNSAQLGKTNNIETGNFVYFGELEFRIGFDHKNINKIIYANDIDRWVVVGNNGSCSISKDGANTFSPVMTMRYSSHFGTSNISCGCYGNELFVVAGENGKLAISPKGTWLGEIWQMVDSSFEDSHITDLIYANGIFVASGGNKIAISTNGTKWTQVQTTHSGKLAYGNGYTVIMSTQLSVALASV